MKDKTKNLESSFTPQAHVAADPAEITLTDFGVRKPGATKEVERILTAANKPLHLKLIMSALEAAGYTNSYQSMSGAMQNLSKKKKVFKKVGPATYALIGYKKTAKRPAAAPLGDITAPVANIGVDGEEQ